MVSYSTKVDRPSIDSLFDLLVSLSKEFIHIYFSIHYSFSILLLWVEESWIGEFTVVEFLEEVGVNLLGGSEEVLEVNFVGAVEVNVVLEVLEHVHVIVGEAVSSDSWEGEGGVIEFPSVDFESSSGGSVFTHGFGNVLGVFPVSSIKSSGEHINLVVEFILSFVKIDAWVVKLNEFITFRVIIRFLIIIIRSLFWLSESFGVSEGRGVNSDKLVIWDGDA